MSRPIYPVSVVLAFFSLLTLVLDLPPLIWHSKNRNYSAAALIFWIVLLNFLNFLNAAIWPSDEALLPGNYDGAGLCDIEVKLQVGSWAALPGTLASIIWNLAKVMDTDRPIIPSKAVKQRQLACDLLLSWGFPAYLMITHYVVQTNRYYIFGMSGCNPSFDNSWVSIVLVYIWPLFLSLLGAYFATLLIIRMRRYSKNLNEILQSHNTTRSRFIRLFAMASVMIVVFTPVQIYILYLNSTLTPLHAYSLSQIHAPGWAIIEPVPSYGVVIFDRWIRVGAGILVFLFFGIGKDARDMYAVWMTRAGLGRFVMRRNRFSRGGGSSPWGSATAKARGLFTSSKSKTSEDDHTLVDESEVTRTSTSSKSTYKLDSPRRTLFTPLGKVKHSKSSSATSILPLSVRRISKEAPLSNSAPGHSPITAAALENEEDGEAVVMKRKLWQESEKMHDEEGMKEVEV